MKPALSVIALPAARMRPWWLWPNVLSLDAPVVALVWQAAFARLLAVELGWTQRGLLAVCVWLAYCGDRLLDARRLPEGSVDSARHAFARDHSKALNGCVVRGPGAGGSDGVANVRARNVGGRGLARGGWRLFFTTPLANHPRAGGPLEGTDGGGGLRGGRAFFCGAEFTNHTAVRFGGGGLGRFVRDELYGDRRLGSRVRCGDGAAFDGAALGGDGTRATDDGVGFGGFGFRRDGVGRSVVAFGAGLGGERVGVAGIGAATGIVFGRSAARVGGCGFTDAVVGIDLKNGTDATN